MPGTFPDVRSLLHSCRSGVVLAGRYRLDHRIGGGSAGEVWRAVDIYGGSTPLAVKFLRCELDSGVARERFDSEVRALTLLKDHRNVVRIVCYGEVEGQPFLVMEYLELSLQGWLEEHRRHQQLPVLSVVWRLFQHVCDAVAAAHRLSSPGPITHRDINPQNVMLVRNCDGEWVAKLLDFGVAKVGARSITWTGERIGTPGYMPPEQASSEASLPCPASDVFSLGILLVEMLTLLQPGPMDPRMDELMQHLRNSSSRQLRLLRADVPDAVWDVIARCLQTEIANRYPDAAVLGQAFAQALAQRTEAPRIAQATTLQVEMQTAPAGSGTYSLVPQSHPSLHTHPTLPGSSAEPAAQPFALRSKLRRLWQWLSRKRGEARTLVLSTQPTWLSDEPTALMWDACGGGGRASDPEGITGPVSRYVPRS